MWVSNVDVGFNQSEAEANVEFPYILRLLCVIRRSGLFSSFDYQEKIWEQ